ncbi:TPA: hypothetical protein QDC20_006358 [Burkholderia aenigmatica]|nr:hypothetical protein [Burkholderia aenigmatica]HDR9513856.1 hypothetical protein [Burkholderia aenigmatica]HDR9591247.1 hypothetical protein [Burkholderia aenigmatica]HDR9599229.1 hypothetical protein [Burkholderia aenigmatica]HDR9612505.1 hypothetical protein [Burkholderia aenigmatica]
MKRHISGLVLGLISLGTVAQQIPEEAGTETEAVGLPDGVTTEMNPLKQAYLSKASLKPALFRPNANMPDIVNEDLLRGMSESGRVKGQAGEFIGYMPKLKVLPCPADCQGDDYEKAVAALIKGYEGNGKYFQSRGEMIVQVRWFHVRSWYTRSLPYGADTFGVSFMLEGKVVSLGKKSIVGGRETADDLARDVGARMAAEMAYTLGVGVKPTWLSTTNNISKGIAGAITSTVAVVDGLFGVEDVRPRIEPATAANDNLLPAIDGIGPNEVEPITEMHYINSLTF